jgi:phosphate transport system substrate-binding protein
MNERSGPPPIVFILPLLLLLGGGIWWFFGRQPSQVATQPNTTAVNNPLDPAVSVANSGNSAFPAPATVASGTAVRIDGSTSMVTVNQNLKTAFERQFPGTTVTTSAGGTDKGIQDLVAGRVDIAAVSRPLTAQEQSQGLTGVPIGRDAIAIVVKKENPFTQGLTSAQLADIFTGKINNWSAVGGSAANLKVINRPAISGTNRSFQELVLKKGNFGTTSNITTLPTDGTTILIQALGTDGIGYATSAQAIRQQTVRIVPIDGLTPDAPNYPYQRQLYYVYKTATPGVQAFLGYGTSPQGQQAIVGTN